jgi:predicted acetyltransferase
MAQGARPMTEGDIEAAAAVQAEAFGGSAAEGVERYRNGPRYTWRDGWVVEMDGEIRAAAIAIPATWWFRGVAYPISAIAGVAVRDVDRRRGFASALMRSILQADLAAARPYSALYPFQHGFYRRLGYASVGLMHYWRIPAAQLPDDPQLRRSVRQLVMADRAQVQGLYSQTLLDGASGLERNDGQWAQRWTREDERWVVFDDGDLRGYLVYRPAQTSLEVVEFVAPSAEAERGLWAFLAAQVEQRSAITLLTPIDPAYWALLKEPAMQDAVNRGFILNDVAALTMSFMVRVVDVRAALDARAFPKDVSGRFSLDLRDPVLKPSGQLLEIQLADGRAKVKPAHGAADVQGDIVILSQIWCGALSASQAQRYGFLNAKPEVIELWDRAFPPGPPYIARADWF